MKITVPDEDNGFSKRHYETVTKQRIRDKITTKGNINLNGFDT